MPGNGLPLKFYDFRRPDKFSRDQIHTLAHIHENFARLATVTLSATLRSPVSVHVKLVDQMTYSEFTDTIPNPTTLAIGSMQPLKGSALLEINPPITFALLDFLFGGPGDGGGLTRDLTEIEQATMEVLLSRLWVDVGSAWGLVYDSLAKLTGLEVNPLFAQIVAPQEMIVLVQFEVKLGAVVETMNLVFPYLTIEPLLARLSSQSWYTKRVHDSGTAEKAVLGSRLAGVPTEAELLVEGEDLSLVALGALKKGSLVALPGADRGESFLRVGGRPLFRLREVAGRHPCYVVEGSPPEGVKKVGPETPAPAVQKALEDLRTGLESTVSRITGGLDELHRQQDVLSDLLSVPTPGPQRPFAFLAPVEPADCVRFLAFELPQLAALVLAHLEVGQAAAVLGALPPEVQPEVGRRIGRLGRAGAEVVAMVEKVLKRKLEVAATSSPWKGDGLDQLARILSATNRSTEKHVVEGLTGLDPTLSAEIRKRLFEFEDIAGLEPEVVVAVLADLDTAVLARALAIADPAVKGFVVGCLPVTRRSALEAVEGGKVSLTEVEAAQRQVIAAIQDAQG